MYCVCLLETVHCLRWLPIWPQEHTRGQQLILNLAAQFIWNEQSKLGASLLLLLLLLRANWRPLLLCFALQTEQTEQASKPLAQMAAYSEFSLLPPLPLLLILLLLLLPFRLFAVVVVVVVSCWRNLRRAECSLISIKSTCLRPTRVPNRART